MASVKEDMKQGWWSLRSYFCCAPSAEEVVQEDEGAKSRQISKWSVKGLSSVLPRILTIASDKGKDSGIDAVTTPPALAERVGSPRATSM